MPSKKKKPDFPIAQVLRTLKREVKKWPTPVVTIYAERKATPYQVLIATILSLRTQDKTTAEASQRIFKRADSPDKMIRLRQSTIEKLIYPVGFYRRKAETILNISRELIEKHDGQVPDNVEDLVKFKGVGRKTANLVVTLGFGKPGICVDVHVHRICNRWGYIKTGSPDETEAVLRECLPKRYWIPINDWLVSLGQNICRPVSPICSDCALKKSCARVDVTSTR